MLVGELFEFKSRFRIPDDPLTCASESDPASPESDGPSNFDLTRTDSTTNSRYASHDYEVAQRRSLVHLYAEVAWVEGTLYLGNRSGMRIRRPLVSKVQWRDRCYAQNALFLPTIQAVPSSSTCLFPYDHDCALVARISQAFCLFLQTRAEGAGTAARFMCIRLRMSRRFPQGSPTVPLLGNLPWRDAFKIHGVVEEVRGHCFGQD